MQEGRIAGIAEIDWPLELMEEEQAGSSEKCRNLEWSGIKRSMLARGLMKISSVETTTS
jgi:hypothetical protein